MRGRAIEIYCSHGGIASIGHRIPEMRRNGNTIAKESCVASLSSDVTVTVDEESSDNTPLHAVFALGASVVHCSILEQIYSFSDFYIYNYNLLFFNQYG